MFFSNALTLHHSTIAVILLCAGLDLDLAEEVSRSVHQRLPDGLDGSRNQRSSRVHPHNDDLHERTDGPDMEEHQDTVDDCKVERQREPHKDDEEVVDKDPDKVVRYACCTVEHADGLGALVLVEQRIESHLQMRGRKQSFSEEYRISSKDAHCSVSMVRVCITHVQVLLWDVSNARLLVTLRLHAVIVLYLNLPLWKDLRHQAEVIPAATAAAHVRPLLLLLLLLYVCLWRLVDLLVGRQGLLRHWDAAHGVMA